METSTINTLQRLIDGEHITIAGKKFRVQILGDGQTFLHGSRQAVYLASPLMNFKKQNTGLWAIRSWRTDTPVLNKALEPLRFILMGDLIEDVTGKALPSTHK